MNKPGERVQCPKCKRKAPKAKFKYLPIGIKNKIIGYAFYCITCEYTWTVNYK